jgi:hypothetical protein
MPQIPDPVYVTEKVAGHVIDLGTKKLLVIGAIPSDLANYPALISGEIVIRYGIGTFVPMGDAVIPGLFAAEYGGMLVGREAWDYIQKNFQMHPRADVVGILLNGQKTQKFLRELDFGIPVRVFVYRNESETIPLTELSNLYVGAQSETVELPELLRMYLPLTTNPVSLI